MKAHALRWPAARLHWPEQPGLISAVDARRAAWRLRQPGVVARFGLIGLSVGVLVATVLAWYLEIQATELVLDQVAERATDQVVLLAVPGHITAADLEPPFTVVGLSALAARLDPLLTSVRWANPGLLQVNIWARDGTLVYSDAPGRAGRAMPTADRLFERALAGTASKETSSLVDNPDLAGRYDGALEVYVPLTLGGQVLGVYEVYQDLAPIRPVRPLVWSAVAAGLVVLLLAVAVVVQGAARLIRRQQWRTVFLAEASAELTRSLDDAAALQGLARLVVPALADCCAILPLQQTGWAPTPTIAHVDAIKERHVVELFRRQYGHLRECQALDRVRRTAQPLLVREIARCQSAVRGGETDLPAVLRALDPCSVMLVPLVTHGGSLGVLALVATTDSGRRYDESDLGLAEELARRCAIAMDNTRLYQEAQAAIRARDEFLTAAAHELKTPITSLMGYAQLLVARLERGEGLETGWVRRALGTIEHQSRNMTRLVVQLLDVSRIETGKLALDRRATDVAEVIEDVVAAVRPWLTRHDLALQVPGPTLALVDPVRLEQVLSNLVSNAIKFSPEGGRISLELAQPQPGLVRLDVRDQGVGIPPERRPHIFERFYQAREGDPLRHLGGLGLGLYLSRHIVELHGGSIDVEAPPDGGTRFVVMLPTGLDATSGMNL